MGDNQLAVAIENHPADSRIKIEEKGVVQTLSSRMGTGGGNVPLVMNERQYALTVGENIANTLTATDYKGTQCLFEPKAYGICSKDSNSMKSTNPKSGIYSAETSRTLDANGGNPSCNQGGIAVVSVQGSMIGRKPENGPKGSGVGENISFTLDATDHHAVCYGIDRAAFNQGENALYKPQITEESCCTLTAKGPSAVCSNYIVRRLTPTECALLQGFPPNWCTDLETAEPTEEDIAFWSEVFETKRKILGKSSKPKSRNQIVKWLKNPHSDSAEYTLWGNGVALPCVIFVLGGIVSYQ